MYTKQIKLTFFLVLITIIFNYTLIFGRTEEKEFNKTVHFVKGGNISIKNVTGKINIESWDREEVEIYALIKVKGEYAEEVIDNVKIETRHNNNSLDISVKYPRKEDNNGFWDWIFKKRCNISVSFKLKVPKISDINAEVVTGSIYVTNIKGEIYTEAVTGSIKAEDILGKISAETVTGSINLHNVEGPISAETVTGTIKVVMPKDINADFNAEVVTGSIHTDFPIVIKGSISKKHVKGKINGGGDLINLEAVTGSIKLLEL